MGRAERSHVRKRRRGCLGGCLTRILLLFGLCAVLFVGACVLGLVKNDPVTGAPSLTLENISFSGLDASQLLQRLPDGLPDLPGLAQAVQGEELPAWAYGVSPEGLTVKALRAGDGEAIFLCADGYTMLLGGGSGMGVSLTAQLLLCGAGHLNAMAALESDASSIGGLPLAMTLIRPEYLLYPDSQTKGRAFNRMIDTARKSERTKLIVPQQGLSFMLGRARVTVIGPARRAHKDERNDGLSVRIDYGDTSVLVMGGITADGERELITSRAPLDADALICAQGGSGEATCQELVQAVSPSIALMTGKDPANAVRVRLTRAGAQVYAMQEHGVMTLVSDGQTIQIHP